MPPLALLPPALDAPTDAERDEALGPLYRRRNGTERAVGPPNATDPFETYDAPIAQRGRYLWVVVELRGSGRRSPRVRALRAERPGHDLLDRLPRVFSRDPEAASFLTRMLAPLDGALAELQARSSGRHALLDPASVPAAALPWLASFLGLALDARWPLARQRQLVAEIPTLWRARGTVGGLRRLVELCTGASVLVVEHFRLRGHGGPILGEHTGAIPSRSVLGSGFRVGGAVGREELTFSPAAGVDPYAARAHRFTVIVAAALTGAEQEVVRDLVALHKPAHTAFDLCTAGAGMRIGRGLLLGLSSVIGRTGGFRTAQVGDLTLGHDAVVGRPRAGTPARGARLGLDTRVG